MRANDVEKLKALPELNLYNFEEDEFVGGKYVLTSPRSLEACDMLTVKPMELLYKPLADFQEEMKLQNLTFQHAYTAYDIYEKDRQKKLRECRDYRDKMIRDNIFNNNPDDPTAMCDAILAADDVNNDDYTPAATPAPSRHPIGGDTSSRHPIGGDTSRRVPIGGDTSRRVPIGGDGSRRVPIGGGGSRRIPIGGNPSSSVPIGQQIYSSTRTRTAEIGKEMNDFPLEDFNSKLNGWRTHPPFSERHLSKHSSQGTKSKLADDLDPYQSADQYDSGERNGYTHANGYTHVNGYTHTNGYSGSQAQARSVDQQPFTGFKSRFMRQKHEPNGVSTEHVATRGSAESRVRDFTEHVATRGSAESRVRDFTSSLPSSRAEAYQNSYAYHRRSYTTDGVGSTINRTSTPYDPIATRTKAIDRSFTNISDIQSNSPREDTEIRGRRRTTSAFANLEKETSTLRNITSAYGDVNMSRSMSLTDLNQKYDAPRQRSLAVKARVHNRGYTSDDEYTSGYRHGDKTEEILARALERRQREIEADLKHEQLEYRYQVEGLRQDLRDVSIKDSKLTPQVDTHSDWRQCRSQQDYIPSTRGAPLSSYLSPRSYISPRALQEYGYGDETLADRTQRERRVELARQQAVQELEAARVKSKKTRLQSERVRRAFQEALVMNERKWRAADVGNNNNDYKDEDTYRHVKAILARSLGSEGLYSSDSNHRLSAGGEANGSRRNGYVSGSREHHRHADEEFGALRASLSRDESVLTEEAVRRHTLLSSLSPREPDGYDDLGFAVEDRLTTSQLSPRYHNGDTNNADPGPLVYGDLVPLTNGHLDPPTNAHLYPPPDGLLEPDGEQSDEYIRRPKKPSSSRHRRAKTREGDEEVVEDKVKEMKSALEERRRQLTEKLKTTARQTQELRAARLESERKERECRQHRANRRILKTSNDNKRKQKTTSANSKGRLTEQVRALKSSSTAPTHSLSPHERDTFDKKVLKVELNNWVTTGHRSQHSRSRSANRNQSQFSLA